MEWEVSVVEDVRKVIQDLISPDVRAIAIGLGDLKKTVQGNRLEMLEMEKRLLGAISSARNEILLTVRNAELTEKLAEMTLAYARLERERTH